MALLRSAAAAALVGFAHLAAAPLALGHDQSAAVSVDQLAVVTDAKVGPAHGWLDTDSVERTPLWPGLGTLTYVVTTTNASAQAYFDQGLRLAYAFNHGEALRSFRRAQQLDPACAMCYWGEALVLGPNINAAMAQEAVAPAMAATAKALALAPGAAAHERALIEALAARYSADPGADRSALDAAYADAMAAVAARFPGDEQIAVLAAEAMMDVTPWDYWQAGGSEPKGRTPGILALLEKVLKANPDHPGAIHYYIHTVEASDRPERAEPYAERLGRLMPGAGHMVHMPAHTFYRIGRYRDSAKANVDAIAADGRYFAETSASGFYRYGLYPHNLHFLLVSAQMTGDGETVIETAGRLDGTLSDDVTQALAWVQPIKAAPFFAHAQFSEPATILALPAPDNGFSYAMAMWHYARGVAYSMQGDTRAAAREADAIASLETSDEIAELNAGIPAADVLAIARLVVEARIAQARGDLTSAIASIEQAVAIEDGLPYMEPPFWYYPLRQSLGALLLLNGEAGRAEAVLRESLVRTPNNGWALFALRESLKTQGNEAGADLADRQLRAAWTGNHTLLRLERL